MAWQAHEMAARLAQDIPEGAVVNLGIGLPTLVAGNLAQDREVLLHSENGILGIGPPASGEDVDWDLIDAGKTPVTLVPGAAIFHHADAFAMIRGGHVDIAVLGAYEVSRTGDLANWSTNAPGQPPAVGGAMDLAAGARLVYVLCKHTTSAGTPKIVETCALPLTGAGVVNRVYTDLAVLELRTGRLVVRELAPGVSAADVQERSGTTLEFDLPA